MNKDRTPKGFNVSNLNLLNTRKKLLIRPSYQRESVWTSSQRQLLIDSIFRNIDIPKIYFREIDRDGYKYEVVDGQQRLTAIFDFMADKFAMPDDADDVEGHPIRGNKYTKLDMDLSMEFDNYTLDVVIYNAAYTDEDIEEAFLRLQNGTPLNAAEKRRAIRGNMRNVVADLAKHKIFELCSFTDKRYAYEDQSAKLLHLMLKGEIADLKLGAIRKTFETNPNITRDDHAVKKTRQAMDFVKRAFATTANPKLKKYAFLSMTFLTSELLDAYNLSNFPKEFALAYLEFEKSRIENEDIQEDEQDPKLAAFTDAARSDLLPHVQYRHEELRRRIIGALPNLVRKDDQRGFSDEQRLAIYLRDKGVCQECNAKVDQEDFEADHIKPHSKGGLTSLANGQLLCKPCNGRKYAN